MCGQRGLLADSDEQVYEIAVSRIFREKYNAILQPILAEVRLVLVEKYAVMFVLCSESRGTARGQAG